jgi:hypothetical protein
MGMKHLRSSGLLFAPETEAPKGALGDCVRKRPAILVHVGAFESADGPISFDEARLRNVVKNHNAMVERLLKDYGGADKMPLGAYPAILNSHDDDDNDKIIGRLSSLVEFAVRDIPGVGKNVACVVAKEITFLGAETCAKVDDGRIYHLSVGIDEETDTLGEVSVVVVPAAPGAMLLKRRMAEDKRGLIQTIIVSKDIAKSNDAAQRIAKEYGADKTEVDETDTSYRYRQREPGQFVAGSYRTFTPKDGVSVVYGKPKQAAKHLQAPQLAPRNVGNIKGEYSNGYIIPNDPNVGFYFEVGGVKYPLKARKLEDAKLEARRIMFEADAKKKMQSRNPVTVPKDDVDTNPIHGETNRVGAKNLKGKTMGKKILATLKALKDESTKHLVKARAASEKTRLEAAKAKVTHRLSKLMQGGRMTPAEFKKADLTKLAAMDAKSFDAAMELYEGREPVIIPGQRGTTAAADFTKLAGDMKQGETKRLRAEIARDFGLKGVRGFKHLAAGEGTKGVDGEEKALEEGEGEGDFDKRMDAALEAKRAEGEAGADDSKKLRKHMDEMKRHMAEMKKHLEDGKHAEAAKKLEEMEAEHARHLSECYGSEKHMKRLAAGIGADPDDHSAKTMAEMQEQIDQLQVLCQKLTDQVGSIIKAEESEPEHMEDGEGVADTHLEDGEGAAPGSEEGPPKPPEGEGKKLEDGEGTHLEDAAGEGDGTGAPAEDAHEPPKPPEGEGKKLEDAASKKKLEDAAKAKKKLEDAKKKK